MTAKLARTHIMSGRVNVFYYYYFYDRDGGRTHYNNARQKRKVAVYGDPGD